MTVAIEAIPSEDTEAFTYLAFEYDNDLFTDVYENLTQIKKEKTLTFSLENNFFTIISGTYHTLRKRLSIPNIEKDKFSKSANYSNTFLSKDRFTYQSKPSMSQDKGDGERLIENQKYGVKLHIFMRKFVQVDKKTQDFIYLGIANSVKYEGYKPIKLELKLEIPLEDKLFEEFTKII
jgi:hypothetical protein